MYSDTLKIEIQDQILIIGLNRPEKRNALNDEAILALEQVFDQMPPGIKCAIIYGEGKHFSAGLDLSSIKERNGDADDQRTAAGGHGRLEGGGCLSAG